MIGHLNSISLVKVLARLLDLTKVQKLLESKKAQRMGMMNAQLLEWKTVRLMDYHFLQLLARLTVQHSEAH